MESRPLTIALDSNGLVVTTIRGDLSKERLPFLKEDVERANAFIKTQFGTAGHTLRTLVDLTSFSGTYAPDALLVLAAYERQNAPYVEKTAAFGGSETIAFLGEIVSGFSKRNNISFFKTKDEALAWVNA